MRHRPRTQKKGAGNSEKKYGESKISLSVINLAATAAATAGRQADTGESAESASGLSGRFNMRPHCDPTVSWLRYRRADIVSVSFFSRLVRHDFAGTRRLLGPEL